MANQIRPLPVSGDRRSLLRKLPPVGELLGALEAKEETATLPRSRRVEVVRRVLDRVRRAILEAPEKELVRLDCSPDALIVEVHRQLELSGRYSLDRVINATGIVLHTNLGRALLSVEALERVRLIGETYSTLEYDVAARERGDRSVHVDSLLRRLTGAEASLVVNNNAAAVLLALESLAHGKEVVISRGELIEIGGAFRIPDIMRRSGARLVEVGTTNRTRLADYAEGINPETALLLKVHTSNYRILGFTESVTAQELVGLGKERGIPVMEDLGSGCFLDLRRFGFPHEPTVQETVAAGMDLTMFSGDKLLGGPQAGIIVGRESILARLRKNPMNRALRIDKMTLAALEATLRAYEDPEGAIATIPTLQMLAAPLGLLRGRARKLLRRLPLGGRSALGIKILPERSQAGGGSLPLWELPTICLAVGTPAMPAHILEERLRAHRPPVIGRLKDERLLLDLRTVRDQDIPDLAQALRSLVAGQP